MGSKISDGISYVSDTSSAIKIGVLGGFGAGKTTFVGAISEIPPLRTEERMTSASELIDDLDGLETKESTTVAMDFGRITIGMDMVLYLFGGPGQTRFSFMINDLLRGALGGIVLLDTRRLGEAFASLDCLEEAGLPYVVAVNQFPGAPEVAEGALRTNFDLQQDTPIVVCNALQRESVREVLIALVMHLMARQRTEATTS